MILSAILDYELSLIYESKFLNCYDASMTRKELMDVICLVHVASVWMPRCFKCDIDMNFYSFIVSRWLERNWWILFM